MPLTPFHFGPGLLLKAAAPRWISMTAFVAAQIAIDVESGYHLLRGEWPVHRLLHTLPLAMLTGILAGLLVWFGARALRLGKRSYVHPLARSEFSLGASLSGGVLGGLTHPLLDAVMHSDMHPFWPVSERNPLLGAISLLNLHLVCVASAVAGALLLWVRLRTHTN